MVNYQYFRYILLNPYIRHDYLLNIFNKDPYSKSENFTLKYYNKG